MKSFKQLKMEHVLLFVVSVLFLFYLLNSYNNNKSMDKPEKMSNREKQEMFNNANSSVQAAQPLGQNESYASAMGSDNSNKGMPPACSTEPISDPSELLPKDTNSQWAKLNPTGSGDLQNVNLLSAGYFMGIDTVGSSLRNANQQVRSEPANPQLNVGPWNNTTITPDVFRTPLEVGQGPQ